jgi:hypothetical protein
MEHVHLDSMRVSVAPTFTPVKGDGPSCRVAFGQSRVGRGSLSVFDPQRLVWFVPFLVIFSPYVVGPIRLEHVTIYGLLALELWNRNANVGLSPGPWILVGLLILPMGVAALASIVAWTPQFGDSDVFFLLAAADNWTLPAASLALGALWLKRADRSLLLRSFCLATLSALSINVVISIIQRATSVNLEGFLAYFWAAEARFGGWSVGLFASEAGRYSGVFNQPAEAGLAYAIGLFMILYLVWVQPRMWPLLSGAAGFMILGGFIAASKTAMNFAVPVFLVIMLFMIPRVPRLALLLPLSLVTLVAGGFLVSLSLNDIFDRFSYAATFDGFRLTGGRWGEGTFAADLSQSLLERSPLIGLGLEAYGSSSDAELVRLIGQSGALGVMCFAIAFGILIGRLVSNSPRLVAPERWLALAVLLLVLASSLGLPTLSANRAGTIACLVLGLTVAAGVRMFPQGTRDRFHARLMRQ